MSVRADLRSKLGPIWPLLACFSAAAVAADHHVATNGDDAEGSGTAAAPWRTIGRALSAAEAGDVIVLHGGVYREAVRIREPDITLMSAANEWAVIECGFGTPERAEVGVHFDVDASGGALRRLEIVGGYYAVKLESRWDWGGANRDGASDILIEDCRIHDSGRDCIKMAPRCDRVTIRRCEIYNSGMIYPPGTPFDRKNAEGIDNVNSDQTLVQDCYIHDIATTGVYFKGGATDCIVERTRVERCGHGGVLLGFDTSPEFFDLVENPGYYESIDCVVRNCIIVDTGYEGIGFFAARGALAANNTVVNTARVGHSPVYFGLTFQDWVEEAGRPASVEVEFVNNLVVQAEPNAAPLVFIRYSEELGGFAALAGMPGMRNNLYFSAAASPRFSDARPTSALRDADFTAWQAHIGGDRDSFVADPRLGSGARLTAESPAIGRGALLASITDDFDGEPRTVAIDIGADQFDAEAPADSPPARVPPDAARPSEPQPPVAPAAPSPGLIPPPGETVGGARPDDGMPTETLDAPATTFLCPATAAATLGFSLLGLSLTAQRRSRR